MSRDDDLQRLEAELGECDIDFMGWSLKAHAKGYVATFVPVTVDGGSNLCLGAWEPIYLAKSDHSGERALAAILYCHWAREQAVELGAEVE